MKDGDNRSKARQSLLCGTADLASFSYLDIREFEFRSRKHDNATNKKTSEASFSHQFEQ